MRSLIGRHGRIGAVPLLLAAVVLSGCSDTGTDSTEPDGSDPPASTSAQRGTDAPPRRWYGVLDGSLVVARRRADPQPLVEPGALDGLGDGPTLVRLGAETLFVAFCCEPAEGESAAIDLTSGTVFETWPGIISSATGDDRRARVLTNGMQVLVEAPGADPLTSSARDFLLPSHTGLSPDAGMMAVVGVTAGEDVLYALAPGTRFIENGTELARGRQSQVTPSLPVIDARGRVWYLEERRRTGRRTVEVVVDPETGEEIDRFEHPRTVVDQDFDATGRWLLVTYADGSLRWRSIDGRTGRLPGDGWTTADW